MPLLQRLHQFLSGPADAPATAALYRTCVAQARSAVFYQTLGVPDTIDGRFDMILLHVFLVMRRLKTEGDMKQKLFDLMFADMDRSLREMGVGDMSVGKKIKPMIMAFYGRAQAYEKALAQSDDELALTLQRNLFGATPAPEASRELAGYVRKTIAALDTLRLEDIMAGRISFAAPALS